MIQAQIKLRHAKGKPLSPEGRLDLIEQAIAALNAEAGRIVVEQIAREHAGGRPTTKDLAWARTFIERARVAAAKGVEAARRKQYAAAGAQEKIVAVSTQHH